MKRTAIVTGGSSGIGRATAAALREAGCTVYELSRHENPAKGIIHIDTDITDEAMVGEAVSAILKREGKIDILVSNAGFGISGAVEFTDHETAKRQMEVNLYGMDNIVRAVLPYMRKAGAGRIIAVSSIAGIQPIPYQTWYSVSKAAVAAYMLALQNEVRQFGITICTMLPGDIRTGFSDAREKDHAGNEIYGGRIDASVSYMEKSERNGMTPEKAGRIIAKCALKKKSRPFVTVGTANKGLTLLIKVLPRRVSNWIVGRLYG